MAYANYTVNNVETNGLLLKYLGTVHTYEKSINLVISIPHEEYLQQQNFIKNCIIELEKFQKTRKMNLDNILFEFKSIQETVNEINTIIMKSKRRIQKRSLFPWAGKAYEFLFGLASEDTVNEILGNINDTQEKVLVLAEGIRNQSDRITDTIDSIQAKNNHTDENVNKILI